MGGPSTLSGAVRVAAKAVTFLDLPLPDLVETFPFSRLDLFNFPRRAGEGIPEGVLRSRANVSASKDPNGQFSMKRSLRFPLFCL